MLKKIFCFAMVVVLLLGTVPCVFADVQATGEIVNTAETAQVSSEGYRDYLQSFSGAEYCSESVVISLKDAYAPQGETLSFVENKDGSISVLYYYADKDKSIYQMGIVDCENGINPVNTLITSLNKSFSPHLLLSV